MKIPRIYSIQSKISFVFIFVLALLVLGGILSIYFSKHHFASARLFVDNIIPQTAKTNELQLTAFQVKGYTRELTRTTNRSGLHLVHFDLAVALTRMEALTATLSHQKSGIDIVSLNFLSQAIRSQAQLVFQLKSQLLEMAMDRQTITNGIRRDLLEFMTLELTRNHVYSDEIHALVHDLLERLILLVEKLNTPEAALLLINQLQEDFAQIKGDFLLKLFKVEHPDATDETRVLMDGIMAQMERLLEKKRQSLEVLRGIAGFIMTLNDLTGRLNRMTTLYIDQIRNEFQQNARQILEKEKRNINLTVGMLCLSIVILFLLHRQIIVQGFGNRLSLISRAMGRGEAEGKALPLPLKGRDEIADMARAADALLKKAKKLKTLATMDELTRVYNRRCFFQLVEKEVKRLIRKKHQAIVLMLDIDHFKQINDTWGHDFGDRTLFEFAKVCSRMTRKMDLFARYGGEEFVLFMPEATPEEGMTAARRLLETVASLELSTDCGRIVTLTVSIGMAQTALGVEEITPAMKQADEALYRAKKLGRNRIEFFR